VQIRQVAELEPSIQIQLRVLAVLALKRLLIRTSAATRPAEAPRP
jgi:hypothetical protein